VRTFNSKFVHAQAKTGSAARFIWLQALSTQGATHPRPQAVSDSLFRDSAFFDPSDLVQVKYEMLRSRREGGSSSGGGGPSLWPVPPGLLCHAGVVQARRSARVGAAQARAKAAPQAQRRSDGRLARGYRRGWTDAQKQEVSGGSGAALWHRGPSAQYPATAAPLSAAGGKKRR
jgi:hypothetical protein